MARSLQASLSAAAAAFLAVAIPPAASAQGGSAAEAVARCRTLPNDSERILCLEQALLTEPAAPAAAPPAPAPAAPAQAAPTPIPATPAVAAAAPSAESRGLRLPGVPFFGRGGDGDRTNAIVSSDDPLAEEFGAVAVAANDDEPEVVPRMVAGVVSASEIPFRRLQVELDNGQVWRQIESDRVRWDAHRYDEPENVEIWPTGLGGYRMLVTSADVMLRVERVE